MMVFLISERRTIITYLRWPKLRYVHSRQRGAFFRHLIFLHVTVLISVGVYSYVSNGFKVEFCNFLNRTLYNY